MIYHYTTGDGVCYVIDGTWYSTDIGNKILKRHNSRINDNTGTGRNLQYAIYVGE